MDQATVDALAGISGFEKELEHIKHKLNLMIAANLRVRIRADYRDLEIYSPDTGERCSITLTKKEVRFLSFKFPGITRED